MSQPYRVRRSRSRVQGLLAYVRRRQLYNAAMLTENRRILSAQEFQWFVNASRLSPLAPPTAEGQLYHAANIQALKLELARYQDRFKALYTLSPVAYVSITPQGLITELNPRAAKLLGGEPQQSLKNMETERERSDVF
ncbi:MAG: hypothetical protein ABL903_08130 [Methylococcales bacterium]